MLKRNRKLNKQALIRESREYGAHHDVSEYLKYPVFKYLKQCHGSMKAIKMLAFALTHLPRQCSTNCADPGGFIVWSDTPHFKEWAEASDHYDEVNGIV